MNNNQIRIVTRVGVDKSRLCHVVLKKMNLNKILIIIGLG